MVSDNDNIKLIQFKIYNCLNAINFVLSCLKNQSLWDNFAGLIDKKSYLQSHLKMYFGHISKV